MASYEVSTLDIAKFEGSGDDAVTFTYLITRSGDLSGPGSVQWNLVGAAPALADRNDFVADTAFSGIVAFAAGQATIELVFSVNSDVAPEASESFGVVLSNPTGDDTIAIAAAFSIIKDDDALHFLGTAGADVIDNSNFTQGTAGDMRQGGNDKVIGSPLDDTVLFGATFNSKDKFDGGAGYDRLILEGDYARGISIVANTLQNVEEIYFVPGFNYKITTGDAAVGAGATLLLDASVLGSINTVTINGSAESDGHFVFLGGAGNDIFTGGSLADRIVGGFGADQLNGGNGADQFVYQAAQDSPLLTDLSGNILPASADTLVSFQTGLDQIDLSAFDFLGDQTAVFTRSTNSFSTDLSGGTGFFGTAGVVVEYAKVNKAVVARVYVDANSDGNLGAGDMMIQLTGVTKGSIGPGNFIY